MITVLGEGTAEGRVDGERVVVDDLAEVIGWERKPEGLCRDSMCVPVRTDIGDPVDLRKVAELLGQRIVVDEERGVAAISVDAVTRGRTVSAGEAVPFTLPDLHGRSHSLTEWAGKKKVLVCWASW